MLQTAHDHGMVWQIDHGSGAESGQDLTLTKLSVGTRRPLTHSSSAGDSISSPFICFTHRFTLGSTPRSDLPALNFRCPGGSVGKAWSSGSRNTGGASPASCWYCHPTPTFLLDSAILTHSSKRSCTCPLTFCLSACLSFVSILRSKVSTLRVIVSGTKERLVLEAVFPPPQEEASGSPKPRG